MIKLTPATMPTQKNKLSVKLEFMHGDADAYTNETFNIHIPPDSNKEELIGRIMGCISYSMDLADDNTYDTSPFVVGDDDWNDSNCDPETGIPVVGAKVHFVLEVKHEFWTDTEIHVGTIVEANADTVTVEMNGSKYVVPNDEDHIAPEASIVIDQDGNQISFKVDGVQVSIETQGDCTCDGQRSASSSFGEVLYFDENGTKFKVSGF